MSAAAGHPRRVRGRADSGLAQVIRIFASFFQDVQGAVVRAIEAPASPVRLLWLWTRLGTIVLLVILALPAPGVASSSAGTAFPLEAETMKGSGGVVSDVSASAGKALRLSQSTAAAASVTTTTTTSTLALRARGAQCKGAPRAVIAVDGKPLLEATVSATSWTTYPATLTTALASGGHTITASLRNPGGTGVCRRVLYLDLIAGETAGDTSPPTVTLTAPTSGSTVSGTVSVSASATDNLGVSKVEFYRNGGLFATVTEAPYRYSWDTTGTANGSYALTAKAYDAANNVGSSSGVTMTVNNFVGIFVAPSGSDITGDGSISKPFATLAKAQATMRLGGPQITYIRGGYYALPAVTQNGVSYGLYLTAADNGQTWSYYPPDGYNSAILDGGSTSSSTGIKELITIDGASHVTINGLQLQHFRWVGIGLHGGTRFKELFPASTAMADSNTVTNNILHDGSYDTSPIGGYGGGAFYGVMNIPNTTVTNNAIYNISTSGIQAEAGGSSGNLSSLWIANNVVLSTCLLVRDCGSIYVQDTNTTSTHIRIINNFVRDSGIPTSKARSIYLDDGVSGAVVSNNISTGVFNFAFTIHGGSNNSISSNIVDMGPSNNREILLYQGNGMTGMTGNTVQSNLIVSGGAGGWYEGKSFGAQPAIKNNVYHQYAGAPVYTRGLGGLNGDASPVSADPQLSCWTYVLASGSPVYSPPVSFMPLPRSWGPPGYAVPKTGTPPSQPYSC